MLVVVKLICFVEEVCNPSVNDAFQDFDSSTGKTDRVVVGRSVLAALLEHWCYVRSFQSLGRELVSVTWQGTCLQGHIKVVRERDSKVAI